MKIYTPTIVVKDFGLNDLPGWAQKSPHCSALLWCAKRSLSFRADLAFGEASPEWRTVLERQAERIYSARHG